MHDVSVIQNRWVYKGAVSSFLTLVFTLFLCGLFIQITVPDTDYSDPFWFLVISIFVIVGLFYSIADYRISKVRKNNFTFSLLDDSVSFKQAVLFVDTTKSLLYGQILGWLPHSIMIGSVGTKILRQNEFNITYADIESFYVGRGLWDRLFGLYRLIFTFKNVNYSKFNPPRTIRIVGVTSPEGTFNALQYKGINIAVIPGLSIEKLNEITHILQQKVLGNNKSSIPKQATLFGVIGAILYGVIAFVLIIALLMFLLS